MAQFFLMPQASPTMTMGVVGKWVAAEGAALEPQSVIAQVETDKATMDIEVFDKGVMLRHLAKEGEEVPPGRPIAIVGTSAGEDISALLAEFAALAAAPAAAPDASSAPVVAAPVVAAPAGTAAAAVPAPIVPAPAAPEIPTGIVVRPTWSGAPIDNAIMEPRGPYKAGVPRIIASPLAKAMAAEQGVNLARVKGSGPGGRIVAQDIAGSSVSSLEARPKDAQNRVTQMRKTIARRLTDVHQQVPVFYLTTSLDASAAVKLKDAVASRGGKISVNDLLIRAVAAALRDVPAVNAAWMGDAIVQKGAVDVGVAVALPDGLLTPVIRDADRKSVQAIADEVRELVARAKAGKLSPEEYSGATFTISNLGMFEIEQFTAILNSPEAAILAVGAAAQVPVVVSGALTVAWRMKVTMTCDHRVIDGALGARFLQALRLHVENPGLMGI